MKRNFEGIKESDEGIEERTTFDYSVDKGPTLDPEPYFDDDKDEFNEYLYLEKIPREYEEKLLKEGLIKERIVYDIKTKDGETMPGYDKDRIILCLEDAAAKHTEIEHVKVYREISTRDGIYRTEPLPKLAINYETKTIEDTIRLVESQDDILKHGRNDFGEYEILYMNQSKENERM